MAHACNPNTLGGRGGWIMRSRDRDHPGQHDETPSLLKIQKISWAWWHMPVIPANQEAEAGELPEPRRWRLWWAEIAPLHSSLGNKSKTPSQKKKKKMKIGFVGKYFMNQKCTHFCVQMFKSKLPDMSKKCSMWPCEITSLSLVIKEWSRLEFSVG